MELSPTMFVHRSEEHTSELQSHHDIVCRLLLEKKKKKNISVNGWSKWLAKDEACLTADGIIIGLTSFY